MKRETPEQVFEWFKNEVQKLWPVAKGSFGLRKNTCVRSDCKACKKGKGHPVYTLHIGVKDRKTSIYIPEDLAGTVEKAVSNGRELEKLAVLAGERYVKALKRERERERKKR